MSKMETEQNIDATSSSSSNPKYGAKHATKAGSSAPSSSNKKQRSAIFPVRLHFILSDAEKEGYDDIISWLPNGRSFRVKNKETFEKEIMPLHFGSSKYRSFQKNLNMWGFETIRSGSHRGTCSHPFLVRGLPYLCYRMLRQPVLPKSSPKYSLSSSRPSSTSTTSEDEQEESKHLQSNHSSSTCENHDLLARRKRSDEHNGRTFLPSSKNRKTKKTTDHDDKGGTRSTAKQQDHGVLLGSSNKRNIECGVLEGIHSANHRDSSSSTKNSSTTNKQDEGLLRRGQPGEVLRGGSSPRSSSLLRQSQGGQQEQQGSLRSSATQSSVSTVPALLLSSSSGAPLQQSKVRNLLPSLYQQQNNETSTTSNMENLHAISSFLKENLAHHRAAPPTGIVSPSPATMRSLLLQKYHNLGGAGTPCLPSSPSSVPPEACTESQHQHQVAAVNNQSALLYADIFSRLNKKNDHIHSVGSTRKPSEDIVLAPSITTASKNRTITGADFSSPYTSNSTTTFPGSSTISSLLAATTEQQKRRCLLLAALQQQQTAGTSSLLSSMIGEQQQVPTALETSLLQRRAAETKSLLHSIEQQQQQGGERLLSLRQASLWMNHFM